MRCLESRWQQRPAVAIGGDAGSWNDAVGRRERDGKPRVGWKVRESAEQGLGSRSKAEIQCLGLFGVSGRWLRASREIGWKQVG
eukprot:387228-Rhodomonas_salina.3